MPHTYVSLRMLRSDITPHCHSKMGWSFKYVCIFMHYCTDHWTCLCVTHNHIGYVIYGEWISNVISHLTGHVIIYLCRDKRQSIWGKWAPEVDRGGMWSKNLSGRINLLAYRFNRGTHTTMRQFKSYMRSVAKLADYRKISSIRRTKSPN